MKLLLMAAGIALITAAPGAHAADNEGATEVAEKDKVQCRYQKVTGSRTKTQRRCLTKANWEAMAAREAESFQQRRNSSTGSNNASGR